MNRNRPANGVLAVAAGCLLSGVLVGACTSSGDAGKSGSSTTAPPVGPNSTAPAGAGTQPKSGPGAGSQGPTKDTYTAPQSAPYPTPGRDPSTVTDQKKVLDSLPGSASSSCARVGSNTDMRAGAIAMGNFQSARIAYTNQVKRTEVPQLDMYVIPRHAKGLKTATVRIKPPSGKARTVKSTRLEELEAYRYIAVTLPIRGTGTYRFDVTAGRDSGCFTVVFGK